MDTAQEEAKQYAQYFFDKIFHIVQEKHEIFGWPAGLQREDVTPTYMKALSNMTYRLQCHKAPVKDLLVKEFGQGLLSELLDRKIDNLVSSFFGEQGVGPKVLFYNDQYRVEDFLVCSPFTQEHMQDKQTRRILTYYIQNLHRTQIPDLPKGGLMTRIVQGTDYNLLRLFNESVEKKQDPLNPEERKKVAEIASLVTPETLAYMQNIIKEDDLVASHNDFLNGNILVLPSGELKLIDFEYTTYNFRTFDIANFINESLFDYGVEESPYFAFFPEKRDSDEEVRDMIKYYTILSAYPQNPDYQEAKRVVEDEAFANEQVLKFFGSQEALDAKIDGFMTLLHAGYLFSHFYWSLWSIIQAKNSPVKFDYVEFGYQRYQDFERIRKTSKRLNPQ